MADTDDGLNAFAARIGLQRRWAQSWKSHYDVTDSKRRQATRHGAVPIAHGGPESIALIERKRAEERARTADPRCQTPVER